MRIVSLKRESNFKHTHVHAEQDRVMRIGPRQKCMRMDTGSSSERTEHSRGGGIPAVEAGGIPKERESEIERAHLFFKGVLLITMLAPDKHTPTYPASSAPDTRSRRALPKPCNVAPTQTRPHPDATREGKGGAPLTLKVRGDPALFSIFLISWKRQSSI